MFNNRKDDDVIVISEEDVTYETPDEDGTPADSAEASADDDLAASDRHDQTVPSGTGRLSAVATPGEAATDEATDDPATDGPATDGPPFGTSASTPAGFGSATTAAAQRADSAADVDDADDVRSTDTEAADGVDRSADGWAASPDARNDTGTAAANGTVNGADAGSAIPMPAAASTATPADATATPADASVTPAATPATPAVDVDSNWPQIQALFVDDPQSAVRQAADVAGGAVAALVAAAKNREQTMRDGWQSDSTGTEDLRTALRGYRDLASRLSTLAQEL
jgi:hypothetical protein